MIPRYRRYHFVRPPRPLQRAKLDNLALVPASLLPYKKEWQALANRLPVGQILIVLPSTDSQPRHALEAVATRLRAAGREVTTLSAAQFARM